MRVENQVLAASSFLREIFKGPMMAAGGFDRDGAEDIPIRRLNPSGL